MPLTEKGKKIKASIIKQYGKERGERVFYALLNKGKIEKVKKKNKKKKERVGHGCTIKKCCFSFV